jgi:hypothetical protein
MQLQAKTNWGNKYWTLLADATLLKPFLVPDTAPVSIPVEFDPTYHVHSIYAIPLGLWSYIDSSFLLDHVRDIFEASCGTALDVQWDASIAYHDKGCSSQFSNWSLTGVRRFTTGYSVSGWATRLRMDVILSTAGGVHTVKLYSKSLLLASGSRTGDGSVTLTPTTVGGVSGTVTLTYTADLAAAAAAWVEASWASKYLIYESTTLLKTVPDAGLANTQLARLDTLGSGVHNIRLKVITDTGVTSGYGTATAATIPFRPPSPSKPAYLDGDWTNTRIIFSSAVLGWVTLTAKALRQWVIPSTGPAGYAYECTQAGTTGVLEPTWPTTVGNTVTDGGVVWTCRAEVTYLIYDSVLDQPTNFVAASKTAVAATGTVTVALDSLTAAAAGVRRLQIRSTCGSIQDPECLTLEIEYAASGSVVLPKPDAPMCWISSVVGRAVTLSYFYDGSADQVTPVTIQLWALLDGASINWSVPDATAAIGALSTFRTTTGTLSFTVLQDGYYQFAIRIADAGGNQSPNTTLTEAQWVGTATPTVPTPTLEVAN